MRNAWKAIPANFKNVVFSANQSTDFKRKLPPFSKSRANEDAQSRFTGHRRYLLPYKQVRCYQR